MCKTENEETCRQEKSREEEIARRQCPPSTNQLGVLAARNGTENPGRGCGPPFLRPHPEPPLSVRRDRRLGRQDRGPDSRSRQAGQTSSSPNDWPGSGYRPQNLHRQPFRTERRLRYSSFSLISFPIWQDYQKPPHQPFRIDHAGWAPFWTPPFVHSPNFFSLRVSGTYAVCLGGMVFCCHCGRLVERGRFCSACRGLIAPDDVTAELRRHHKQMRVLVVGLGLAFLVTTGSIVRLIYVERAVGRSLSGGQTSAPVLQQQQPLPTQAAAAQTPPSQTITPGIFPSQPQQPPPQAKSWRRC